MANISEEMPKKVKHLNRKLREVIRVVNAMQNVRVVDHKDPNRTGKWMIGERESVFILE